MPYRIAMNNAKGLSTSSQMELTRELDLLRAELDNLRAEYATLLAKLDADAGVTDTNYAATCGLAAAQFTAL